MLLRRHLPAVAVFLLCTTVTVVVIRHLDGINTIKDEERFTNAVERLEHVIQDRLTTYTDMLRATAGMLDVEGPFDARRFRAFVRGLDLQNRYPGIRGVGFSRRVTPEDLDPLVTEQRRDVPDFAVWPEQPRTEYHAVLYLEPLNERNRGALGYDMFTEPVRRAAMERARDSAEPSASGPVRLIGEAQGSSAPGFLVYMPLYEGGGIPPSIEKRRERLRGFVYGAFGAPDLFTGMLALEREARAGFSLVDAAAPSTPLHHMNAPTPAAFTTSRRIAVGGREWALQFFSLPGLQRNSSSAMIPAIFWSGLAISVVLSGLVAMQTAARARLEKSDRETQAASHRFQQLANSIPQLAWMARADGWITWYNDRWYEYTGTTPEQMEGWGWQRVHHPDVLPRVMERWQASITSGLPFDMEFPIRRSDGQFRWFLTRVEPLRDPSGTIVQWFGTNTEVQALRDAEQAAREHAAEAERVGQLKDEFLATLSHELRTPLNAVMGWTRLLEQGGVSADRVDAALETIQRNAQAQSRLIDDLLDMSRIVSGRLRVEPAEVPIAEILEAAVAIIRPAADAKGVRVITQFEHVPPVIADASRLQQVFWNLLSNSVKFTPAGGRVEVVLRRGEEYAVIQVRDTGVGITPEFLPWVFDRFRQADASTGREHAGLGLGLSIARSLVQMHGGTIDVASDGLGQGAMFTVRLPMAAAARREAQA